MTQRQRGDVRLRGYLAVITTMPPRGRILTYAAIGVLAGIVGVAVPVLVAFTIPLCVCTYALVRLIRTCTPVGTERDRTLLLAMSMLVLLGHVAIGWVINSSHSLTLAMSPDSLAYHQMAEAVADGWHRGGADIALRTRDGKEGFTYAISVLYWLFGPHAASALVLNAALSAAVLPLTYDTTRRLFGAGSARIAIVLPAVLPGFVFWSSQLLREASIICFLAVVANATVRLTGRIEMVSISVLGCAGVVLFTLRPNVALVALCGAVAGLALGLRSGSKGLLIGSAAVAMTAGLMAVAGVGQSGLSAVLAVDFEQLSYFRQKLGEDAGSAIDANVDISSPLAALAFLPSAAVSFLLGPFPWEIRSAFQAGGLIDACAVWVLLPSLYRGLRHGARDAGRRMWPLLVPAAMLLVTLSLLISNYGMIVRQRPQMLIFLLPVMAHGWAIRHRTRAAAPDGAPVRP
jgi:hypothetical protein